MDSVLAGDLARLPELLGVTREYAARFLAGLAERPVALTRRRPADPSAELPAEGRGLDGALAEFGARWEAGLSGSAGPRYLGFVTGGATPAGLAGDWLTAAYDQNAASGGDSCAAELEHETLRWLRELFGLSEAHSGAFVSGATASNTVGLAIAREWVGERLGVRVATAGAAALGPVDVLSGTPHSSIGKALSVLGIGRDRLRAVPTLPDREAVDVAALARALEALDGRPAIVVANAGTVNTVDFDDLRAVAALRDRFPFWLHVDAAFGGFAALSSAHAHLTAGLDLADSVCVDLHKWLNVPYDSAVQFTRRRDLQTAVFHNASPYLGAPDPADPDFLHLTPENSRRLRALPAWLTLTAYGAAGHREIVVRNAACAASLAASLDADPAFVLLAPARLNVVCFALAGDQDPDRLAAFSAAVTASGEAFLSPTVHAGRPALRAAFSNWRTTRADTARVLAALDAAVKGLG
ncbi:pyridoxal phosphate-dependent decarboxylase family protein [Actinacidiphila sp. ITFR-21]|uniref:pyridoxal phosphate-dependent decarboxylase family protein n=1 Tax=Actinacidiphila sp. ITFR-21 TaxID=3075199 RepID=UPI00288C2342|nr:pyridoxal-dependent decarboxylase [Streptomyces sp. ITFR-21]WNI15209.1 pyridoxal-dependent decarboxylase [Streptomyces sp. ITFR-21]